MGGCASQPVHPSYVAAQEAELERFRGTPRSPGPVPTTEARQPEEAWESPSGDGGDVVDDAYCDDNADAGDCPRTTTPVGTLSPVGPVTEVFGGKRKDAAPPPAAPGAGAASPQTAKAKPRRNSRSRRSAKCSARSSPSARSS